MAAKKRTTRKRPAKRTTKQAATKRSAPRATPTPLTPAPGQRLHVLSVPFEERGVASANGARWDPARRASVYLGTDLPYGLTPYASQDYSWERWIEDDANGAVAPCARVAPMTPRPHQVTASNKIVAAAAQGYRGFVEADDVGLGKTISVLDGAFRVAQARGATSMLIVCPKGVIPHWRRTIAAMGDRGLRIVVINYDRVKNLLAVPESAKTAKTTRTANKRIANQGVPLVAWDLIVMDESHKLANPDSQRTRAMSRIARYAQTAKDAPFVIWASATIGTDPASLSYLAPLLAQLTGASRTALKDFGKWLADEGFAVTYNERFSKWEWGKAPADASDAEVRDLERHREADLARIHTLLFAKPDSPAIRRLPNQIANWPVIQRIPVPVEFDLTQQRHYGQAWSEFRRDMAMAQRGKDARAGAVARLRFRQKASLLRVQGTVDHTMDLIENGHQVAISVAFLESLDALRTELEARRVRVAEYSGRNQAVREQERLRFQTGDAQVVLFTVAEAISLHQQEMLADGTLATDVPRSTVVHDPRWGGIEAWQIEGRCHRDGQFSAAYYPFGQGTVEAEVIDALLAKIASIKGMSGDDASSVKEMRRMFDRAGMREPSAQEASGVAAPPAPRSARSPSGETPSGTLGRGRGQRAPRVPVSAPSDGSGSLASALAGGDPRRVSRRRASAQEVREGMRHT